MKFEWDEVKNERNIRKHGFDFADAEKVFAGTFPLFVCLDTRKSYGEDRWQGIGLLDGIVIVVIVFTEPRTNIVRIISMRKATKKERAYYEKRIKNRLGAD
jgi:uncharacterized DUF497 family protein